MPGGPRREVIRELIRLRENIRGARKDESKGAREQRCHGDDQGKAQPGHDASKTRSQRADYDHGGIRHDAPLGFGPITYMAKVPQRLAWQQYNSTGSMALHCNWSEV